MNNSIDFYPHNFTWKKLHTETWPLAEILRGLVHTLWDFPLTSPVVVAWLRVVVVRLDHGEGHDVVAPSTHPNSIPSTPAHHVLPVHRVVCVVLELKLLLLLQWPFGLRVVALPRVLLFRLQSLLVSAATGRLASFGLFCRVFLRLFDLSVF